MSQAQITTQLAKWGMVKNRRREKPISSNSPIALTELGSQFPDSLGLLDTRGVNVGDMSIRLLTEPHIQRVHSPGTDPDYLDSTTATLLRRGSMEGASAQYENTDFQYVDRTALQQVLSAAESAFNRDMHRTYLPEPSQPEIDRTSNSQHENGESNDWSSTISTNTYDLTEYNELQTITALEPLPHEMDNDQAMWYWIEMPQDENLDATIFVPPFDTLPAQ